MVRLRPTPQSSSESLNDTSSAAPQWQPADSVQSSWGYGSTAQPERRSDDAVNAVPAMPSAYGASSGERDVWRPPTPPVSSQPHAQPLQPTYTGTNPFLRQQAALASLRPASQPSDVPPLPDIGGLSIQEPSNNPWQPALDVAQTAQQQQQQQQHSYQPSSYPPTSLPSQNTVAGQSSSTSLFDAAESPALISLASDADSTAWSEVQPSHTGCTQPSAELSEIFEGSRAWDELSPPAGKGKGPQQTNDALDPANSNLGEQNEGRSLLDSPSSSSQVPTIALDGQALPPPLPPRPQSERATPSFSRVGEEELKETYHIKRIAWTDPQASTNPRKSPILTQNANGPCPLLALVNTLVLTSPADAPDPPLVEMLRAREQITLQFLVDAVLDELMSDRRRGSGDTLPDMSLMYAFLKELHTGMNVNPRFLPSDEVAKALKRTSLSHVHPSQRDELMPGTFEPTTELDLYSKFSIPLVHGWIPKREEPAYDAFRRQVASYEDAHYLLFREEELEQKLEHGEIGLVEEEQQLYQDILTIRSFLTTSAAQLTPWGLEAVTRSIEPGTFAILFRNDHFSTLYRHPGTLQLLQLVTDAGYATHEEVVWESLVDVQGESAEFFSGDFRVVGGAEHGAKTPQSPQAGSSHRRGPGDDHSSSSQLSGNAESRLSAREQEDRDLALALQLQEEEEARMHRDEDERRRASSLSERYIEQQALRSSPHPTLPPRPRPQSSTTGRSPSRQEPGPAGRGQNTGRQPQPRTSSQTARSVPLTYRPSDEEDGDAPPSYEHAAKQRPYQPPVGHPSHPQSSAVPLSPHPPQSSAGSPRQSLASSAPMRSPAQGGGARLPAASIGPPGNRPLRSASARSSAPYPPSSPIPPNGPPMQRLRPIRSFSQMTPAMERERAALAHRDDKCAVM